MNDDKCTQPPSPRYRLKEWRGSGWAIVATADDIGELMKFTAVTAGNIGEDWTIDCECGAGSTFYGCRSSAHV